jgi:hypothetical protein
MTSPVQRRTGRPRRSRSSVWGVDAERVVHGRREVGGAEAVRDRIGAEAVGLADHLAPDHAAPGEHGREDRRPVVAAWHVAGIERMDPRCPPELAEHHDERLIEQPARPEVVEQRGDRAVERRQEIILEAREVGLAPTVTLVANSIPFSRGRLQRGEAGAAGLGHWCQC